MPLVLATGAPCPPRVPDILRLPAIQDSARAFLALPVRKLSAPTPMVYVAQREAAFCRPGRRMMWAGSGEATTCHIVAFRDAANGDALVTHIDGSEGQMPSLLKLLEKFSRTATVDVFVVGGFIDGRNLSTAITVDLVRALVNCPLNLRLQLLCVGPLNDLATPAPPGEYADEEDAEAHKPRVMAAAIELATGRFEPVDFVDRGPDVDLRIALVFGDLPDLLEVYDTETEELIFRPTQYRVLKNLVVCRALPDAQLLRFFSTSPEAEGPNFVTDLRAAFDFMYENPEPEKFFKGQSRRYRCTEEGKWVRVNGN